MLTEAYRILDVACFLGFFAVSLSIAQLAGKSTPEKSGNSHECFSYMNNLSLVEMALQPAQVDGQQQLLL